MKRALSAVWTWLRAWSGDSAYERYLVSARSAGVTPLSREDFYLDSLRRRYSSVSRCC